MKIKISLVILFIMAIHSSCLKIESFSSKQNTTKDSTCIKFKNLHIMPVKSFTCGEDIIINVDSFPKAIYNWKGPSYEYNNYQNIHLTNDANIFHRGWYYVTIYCDTCIPIKDSVFVNVKLPQGVPSCNPVNNTSTYSNGIPTLYYTNTIIDSFVGYQISSSTSNSTLSFSFNDYWLKHKLEAGIYYTTGSELDLYDKESMDKVFIENRYAGERWFAENNKPVFISYIGGKLTIIICNISTKAVSSNGSIYTSDISSKITLP